MLRGGFRDHVRDAFRDGSRAKFRDYFKDDFRHGFTDGFRDEFWYEFRYGFRDEFRENFNTNTRMRAADSSSVELQCPLQRTLRLNTFDLSLPVLRWHRTCSIRGQGKQREISSL